MDLLYHNFDIISINCVCRFFYPKCDIYFLKTHLRIPKEEGKRSMYLECPGEITEDKLGEPPRVVYPVVVVTCLCNVEDSSEPTDIVVQFTVIHLKDTYCTLDSHIVYQFVKTNHNNVISLQPIFMSAGESNTQHEVPNHTSHSNCSDKTRNVTQHASTSQCYEPQGQGHLLKDYSSRFLHCKSCGRIQKGSEGVPATREHEMCSCVLSDLDNRLDDIIANGNIETELEDLDHVENSSQEVDNSSLMGNNENIEDYRNRKHDTENSHSESDDSDACCVCQSLPVLYAVLPCRHACVCQRCISLLDKCPICRSYIESYFRISEHHSSEELQSSNNESDNVGLNRWQIFNQRLNEMLGFV
ncbi:zinc finger protein [Mactra antiquata]